jgi:fructokinase
VVSVDTTGAGDAFVAGLLASLAAKECQRIPRRWNRQSCRRKPAGAGHYRQRAMTALPYQHDLNLILILSGCLAAHFVASITFIKSV